MCSHFSKRKCFHPKIVYAFGPYYKIINKEQSHIKSVSVDKQVVLLRLVGKVINYK